MTPGFNPRSPCFLSGLVLEFHREQHGETSFWYRLGQLTGTDVTWNNYSIGAGVKGYWPAVAVTKEGYVILVWSNLRARAASEQW
jgi:hypothetical protein